MHLLKTKTAILMSLMLTAAVLFIPGCSDKTVEEERFVKLYTDLVIAQDTSSADYNTMIKIREQVLSRYGVSEDEYRNTVEYYNDEPGRWEMFFDKVIAYTEELKQNAAAKP